jgi:hypothetical protein
MPKMNFGSSGCCRCKSKALSKVGVGVGGSRTEGREYEEEEIE